MKRPALCFMVILILTGMFISAFHVPEVKAAPFYVYIRADGSIEPSTANITTLDNVTYTFTDDNRGGIVVERDNIVIDGAGYTIQGIISGSVHEPGKNDTGVGVNLTGRSNVMITCMTIVDVREGVALIDASNCTILRNHIATSGPWLGDCGIGLVGTNCTVLENKIGPCYEGIHLQGSGNRILRNEMYNNLVGIYVDGSSNNTITGNHLELNSIGIYIWSSSNDKFYHNNFYFIKYNYDTVVTGDWAQDSWNDAYPSGGNYWSNYTGVDMYSGPYQNETGSDGIGDTPYAITENATDVYPLMGPWTVVGEYVTVIPSITGMTYPPSRGVGVTFSNVTSEGMTTMNMSQSGPDPPKGLKLAGDYYDIKTTASYSGKIEISITYDDSNMTQEEEEILQLMQWNETSQEWINITTHIDTQYNLVYGETNHLSFFGIMRTLVGDINHDLAVDIYDAIILSGAFGSRPGDPRWNPSADMNNDCIADIFDAIMLANHFGQTLK